MQDIGLKKHVQCFTLFSRSLDRNARRLARQFSGRIDFYVLTYDDKGVEKDETTDGIRHIVYNRESLKRLFEGSAPKFTSDDWSIMPGNLDLCHLLFVWQNPDYDYYWFCEDDVRYTGNMCDYIEKCSNSSDDLIATNYRKPYVGWPPQKSFVSPIPGTMSPKSIFLPFFRISKPAANLIINAYARGWSGHHEITWPSILLFHDRAISDLNTVVKGSYTSSPHRVGMGPGTFIFQPPKLVAGMKKNTLYHPVKPFTVYSKRTLKWIKTVIRKRNTVQS